MRGILALTTMTLLALGCSPDLGGVTPENADLALHLQAIDDTIASVTTTVAVYDGPDLTAGLLFGETKEALASEVRQAKSTIYFDGLPEGQVQVTIMAKGTGPTGQWVLRETYRGQPMSLQIALDGKDILTSTAALKLMNLPEEVTLVHVLAHAWSDPSQAAGCLEPSTCAGEAIHLEAALDPTGEQVQLQSQDDGSMLIPLALPAETKALVAFIRPLLPDGLILPATVQVLWEPLGALVAAVDLSQLEPLNPCLGSCEANMVCDVFNGACVDRCPEGETYNPAVGACERPCGEGEVMDPATGLCVLDCRLVNCPICGPGTACDDNTGLCVPLPLAGRGDPCDENGSCDEGLVCLSGLCELPCGEMLNCHNGPLPCPEGLTCQNIGETIMACRPPVAPCLGEGEGFEGFDTENRCCEGLVAASDCFLENGECLCPNCPCFVCLPCGDGICAEGENACNCPEDCTEPQGCHPLCDALGTWSEGWYDSCTGELIGWALCSGCQALCQGDGTRSEGWYDSCGQGLDGTGLILYDDCASCPEGEVMDPSSGECIIDCRDVNCNICNTGEVCHLTTGLCAPPDAAGLGGPCDASDGCGLGQSCQEGLCVMPCLINCIGAVSCPEGLECRDHLCLPPAVCPSGQVRDFSGECVPDCRLADCPRCSQEGAFCDHSTGLCAVPSLVGIAKPCDASVTCPVGLVCLPHAWGGDTVSTCELPCDYELYCQEKDCPGDLACQDLGDGQRACRPQANVCPEGQVLDPPSGDCLPDCRMVNCNICQNGAFCDPGTGLCAEPSRDGLAKPCDEAGCCGPGQVCLTYLSGGNTVNTCEIPCHHGLNCNGEDLSCPEGLECRNIGAEMEACRPPVTPPCLAGGERFEGFESENRCCEGLVAAPDCMLDHGECLCPACPCFVCLPCGDGVCTEGETSCNCPEDCPEPQACQPVCDAIGSWSEGWYDSCSGELIGWAICSGCEARCRHNGTRSEGWYDSCGQGLEANGLILYEDCDPCPDGQMTDPASGECIADCRLTQCNSCPDPNTQVCDMESGLCLVPEIALIGTACPAEGCGPGLACLEGRCELPCSPGCGDYYCPQGLACADIVAGQEVCRPDCPEGQVLDPASRECITDCRMVNCLICEGGTVCDMATGLCVSPSPEGLGEDCGEGGSCGAGQTCMTYYVDWCGEGWCGEEVSTCEIPCLDSCSSPDTDICPPGLSCQAGWNFCRP